MLAPEARGIFPGLSVEENLEVLLRSKDERAQAYDIFPILGQRLKQQAGLLSGGEQQMLSLAPALVNPPDVFVADEPTLGLAPLAAEEIMNAIRRLRDLGSTILLVEEKAHEVLEVADTVAFMELGRLVWMGPCDQLDEERLAGTYLGMAIMTTACRALGDRQHREARVARASCSTPTSSWSGSTCTHPTRWVATPASSSGVTTTGVIATNDVDELLAVDADCLCYLGDGIGPRAAGAVEEMSRFLRAGRNVVSTSFNQLVNPKTAADDLRIPLEEACRAGGTSFFNNGADPGFGSDLIPLTLLSLMDDIESVRVQEIVNYSHYDQAWVMRELFGFGQPLDYESPLFTGGALTEYWGGVVTMVADALGLELDEIREVHEFAAVDVDVDVEIGRIDAGTIAAIRFEVQGIVDGDPVVVVEHDTRIHDDAAPDWPQCAAAATTATASCSRVDRSSRASSTWRTSTAATADSSPVRCAS